MSNGDIDNLQAKVVALRTTVNELESGPVKTAVREATEHVIAALFVAYPGLHFYLPAIED